MAAEIIWDDVRKTRSSRQKGMSLCVWYRSSDWLDFIDVGTISVQSDHTNCTLIEYYVFI